MKNKLKALKIKNIEISIPIIQGAMGVRVSASRLVSAVSGEGALGVIASVGLGEEGGYGQFDYVKRSKIALSEIITETKNKTSNPFGVNIMCALSNYDDLVKVCAENDVPVIFSGAGLPLNLPALVGNKDIALVPIVSSGRAADIICRAWKRKYNRIPDAFVVEGPMAGGHLGFGIDEIDSTELKTIFRDVQNVLRKDYDKADIPLVAAGGIFTGEDIAFYLREGASGVQMATRFIGTIECDASDEFKKEVLRSKQGDSIVIESPVKLPGRVIKNNFVEKILNGDKIDFKCKYKCLKTCDVGNVNYCIADALVNAYRGNMERGFVMAGANCYRVNQIVSVRSLIKELVEGAVRSM